MTHYEQLRSKYEPSLEVNFDDWHLRRLSKLSQLQALNSELERMVAALEEERKKEAESKRFNKGPVRLDYSTETCPRALFYAIVL
jgi:hypothetical protein